MSLYIEEEGSVTLPFDTEEIAIANVIFNPIAKKLRIRQDEEELYCSTIIEGIIAIQAGENPKYLREHLLASIKQSQQRKILAKAEAGDFQGKEQEDK